jgi:NADH dehydrogenase FAD-containing subunit
MPLSLWLFLYTSDSASWSGFVLSRQLDQKKFQTVVVSPRSYFVFTPLLASTAVGTLEFRAALEAVRGRGSGVEFFQGWADDVNFDQKRLTVEAAVTGPEQALPLSGKKEELGREKGKTFDISYDKLVVAVGCYNQTFGTKGVKENALFLKDMSDSRKIRKRILECKSNWAGISFIYR